MKVGGDFAFENEVSFGDLINPSDPHESGADVILWMGPDEEPIYAHSVILKNASDFYKAALSLRWNTITTQTSKPTSDNKDELDSSSDTLIAATGEESSVPSTSSTACPTPTKEYTRATVVRSSNIFEIHHPEYDKKHMIQLLHYVYRVPTTLGPEDVLDVALLANHLLMTKLQEKCLQSVVKQVEHTHKYAFRLYLLASTMFLDSGRPELMTLALQTIYESFNLCIHAIPDVASLSKREVEALIVGLPLNHVQKWILLIMWAMASTGMMDETCTNPLIYIFRESSWKEKVNESFKQIVKDLVHLIPFPNFSKSDYDEFVRPFKDLGVLEALNLQDFLICLFESKEPTVQDPQLLASVKLQEPLSAFFPTFFPLSIKIKTFLYDHAIQSLSKGGFFTQVGPIKSNTVYRDGLDCRITTRMNLKHPSKVKTLHVFQTTKGEQAAVVVYNDLMEDTIIYTKYNTTHTTTQYRLAEQCKGVKEYGYTFHSSIGTSKLVADDGECDCLGCPTYVQSAGLQCRVRCPEALADQPIRDYIIFYI